MPAVASSADYVPIRSDDACWLPALRSICRRHGLTDGDLVRCGGGTNVVFAAGRDQIIKLYPPYWTQEFAADRAVAERVYGRLGVATPEVRAHGELEGWPYLVMSRLAGTPLHEVWEGLEAASRLALVGDLGELLARMHALPAQGLDALTARWSVFIGDRPGLCVEHHRRKGVAERWLAQIPAFLARVTRLDPPGAAPVILSGDLHDGHLLAREERGRWRLCGLFDFDDALVGFHEYDFASAGLFMMTGRPELLRAFLRAYGYADPAPGAELSERLLAYTLLHRYRDLNWIVGELLAGRGCATLEELASVIYRL